LLRQEHWTRLRLPPPAKGRSANRIARAVRATPTRTAWDRLAVGLAHRRIMRSSLVNPAPTVVDVTMRFVCAGKEEQRPTTAAAMEDLHRRVDRIFQKFLVDPFVVLGDDVGGKSL
jgi:hypothetical protein